MSLIQTVFEPDLEVYERQYLQVLRNVPILPANRILFLMVKWNNAIIPSYGSTGTICYALRWRLDGGSWNVEDIVNGAGSSPLLPSFLGLTFERTIDGITESEGIFEERWFILGTATTQGTIEIQFSINPVDTSNPFAGV